MKRFFGGLLVAIGILIAGLAGLCSLALASVSLSSGSSILDNLGAVSRSLGISAVPFVLGIGCIFAGRALLKP